MAEITAEKLVAHLEKPGFVVMKRPPVSRITLFDGLPIT
jgi:hypothetical protein